MHLKTLYHSKLTFLAVVLLCLGLGAALLFAIDQTAGAQGSPFHPTFALLDENGDSVLDSGFPISTMQTCGACHDATFIEEHSFHADIGLSTVTEPGQTADGRPWDTSDGLFGRWNPLNYRYLSPAGDERIDLTLPEWIQVLGPRHVGGGPSVYTADGQRLTDLEPSLDDPRTFIIDPDTGDRVLWDWQESGVVEMNCFLCHLPEPDNTARVEALQAGDFGWANTATLAATGLVQQVDGQWVWNEAAFNGDGTLLDEYVTIQDPSTQACGQCHGNTHVDPQTPMVIEGCSPTAWSTITTGQIYSPQRMSDSGVNFIGKHELARSWDIHAERVLACTDCHYSLNNPVYFRNLDESRPDHLTFDPRRIDIGEYLYRPLHQFAKGQSAQSSLAAEFDNTMRRCESCHAAEDEHEWLPYWDRHTSALSCESCHVPQIYGPAREYNDWTVLRLDGTPQSVCRGIDEVADTYGTSVISGYEPVLLPRENGDGSLSLAPYNLVTSWYWIYGEDARPVPYRDLQAVWLDGDTYHAAVLDVFDANADGTLDEAELYIDTPEKADLIAARLEAQGLDNPRIVGDIQPYGISHNVTHDDWATKDCQACHSEDSRLTTAITVADRVPNGVIPGFVSNDSVAPDGQLIRRDDGSLVFKPTTDNDALTLYVFGHDSVQWIDLLGALMFVGTLGGVGTHSTLRYLAARRRPAHEPRLKRTYMYSVYERQWHWLQTVAILALLFTGLIIHKPDIFGVFSFRYVVEIHNVLAAILVINAALAAFYHLASGEIRQFMPEPRGFFGQAFAQAKFYMQGIFRGEAHPLQKTPDRKMNPLQQLTYLAILNVLLPLQVITGALMWGAQTWPDTADSLGGLGFLAPLHTLVAWTFATFILAHVYLTTTAGHTPVAGIKSMIMGWDDVEVHEDASASSDSIDTAATSTSTEANQ